MKYKLIIILKRIKEIFSKLFFIIYDKFQVVLNLYRVKKYCCLGNTKFDLGNYKGAIENYSKAIEFNIRNAILYLNRGSAKSALGQYEEAVEDYKKAIKLDPDDAESYAYRGLSRYHIVSMKKL